jgi:ribose transport system ATP-binding protein
MALVPEDRKTEGLMLARPIAENLLAAAYGRVSRGPFVDRARAAAAVGDALARLRIKVGDPNDPVATLSGGNQQKVVLAKWLATAKDLLIFDEPTRGIDVNGKAAIHHLIRAAAVEGMAVIMISSELMEVVGMSDRILVMREGRVAGILPGGSSEAEIMALATQGEAARAPAPTAPPAPARGSAA